MEVSPAWFALLGCLIGQIGTAWMIRRRSALIPLVTRIGQEFKAQNDRLAAIEARLAQINDGNPPA